ncbi:DUF1295 domain-containing protein [Ancylobacter terrae]|uniref:DUF1295 domain-containing protein n=1 Tax=Ancylobacter sp. sgz301288 TaxID=3342077 RepID=UPI00385F519C
MGVLIAAFVLVALALSLAMLAAYVIAEKMQRSGLVDGIWSLSTGSVAIAALIFVPAADADGWRRLLVACLVAIWSLRLGSHLLLRAARGGDDPRYAWLRQQWGADARRRMFLFLQAQAIAAIPLVATVLFAGGRPGALDIIDLLGVSLVIVAIVGEAIADRQLSAFRAGSHGKLCDRGLWSWSRHPNYFFEWLIWLGIAVIALDPRGSYALGWCALIGPLVMYWLLVHVSGIPPLEAHMLRTRGDLFRAYRARVSAFWPWPPRRQDSQRDTTR